KPHGFQKVDRLAADNTAGLLNDRRCIASRREATARQQPVDAAAIEANSQGGAVRSRSLDRPDCCHFGTALTQTDVDPSGVPAFGPSVAGGWGNAPDLPAT